MGYSNTHAVLGLALAIAVNASCSTSDIAPLINEDLTVDASPRWLLNSFGTVEGESILAVEIVPFTFSYIFSEQGVLTGFLGFDGCNVFSSAGVVEQDNFILPVNGVNVDAAFCDNLQFSAYLQQFDHFYSVIGSTFSSQLIENQLVLTSQAGQSLTFEQCNPTNADSADSICIAT